MLFWEPRVSNFLKGPLHLTSKHFLPGSSTVTHVKHFLPARLTRHLAFTAPPCLHNHPRRKVRASTFQMRPLRLRVRCGAELEPRSLTPWPIYATLSSFTFKLLSAPASAPLPMIQGPVNPSVKFLLSLSTAHPPFQLPQDQATTLWCQNPLSNLTSPAAHCPLQLQNDPKLITSEMLNVASTYLSDLPTKLYSSHHANQFNKKTTFISQSVPLPTRSITHLTNNGYV